MQAYGSYRHPPPPIEHQILPQSICFWQYFLLSMVVKYQLKSFLKRIQGKYLQTLVVSYHKFLYKATQSHVHDPVSQNNMVIIDGVLRKIVCQKHSCSNIHTSKSNNTSTRIGATEHLSHECSMQSTIIRTSLFPYGSLYDAIF